MHLYRRFDSTCARLEMLQLFFLICLLRRKTGISNDTFVATSFSKLDQTCNSGMSTFERIISRSFERSEFLLPISPLFHFPSSTCIIQQHISSIILCRRSWSLCTMIYDATLNSKCLYPSFNDSNGDSFIDHTCNDFAPLGTVLAK